MYGGSGSSRYGCTGGAENLQGCPRLLGRSDHHRCGVRVGSGQGRSARWGRGRFSGEAVQHRRTHRANVRDVAPDRDRDAPNIRPRSGSSAMRALPDSRRDYSAGRANFDVPQEGGWRRLETGQGPAQENGHVPGVRRVRGDTGNAQPQMRRRRGEMIQAVSIRMAASMAGFGSSSPVAERSFGTNRITGRISAYTAVVATTQ